MSNEEQFRTPGQLIESMLRERGWSNRVLSAVLEIEESGVSKVIANKKAVTPEIAIALEEVFGVPAERFLAIQRDFDLKAARIVVAPNPARAARAKVFSGLPIAELIKRNWLDVEDARDVQGVEDAVKRFFGVSDLDEIERLPHAAKRSDSTTSDSLMLQLAWLYRVRQIAKGLLAQPFSAPRVPSLLSKLKPLLSAPEEARHVPRLLNEHGIRFLCVEALRGSKIDGVCFWLNERSPVIALTMRFDRMDNFWFVLRHELEHVILRHGLAQPKLDLALESRNEIDEEERLANLAASDFCAPSARIASFIARKAPLFPERDFLGLANVLRVHPGLVAGQIQFSTGRYDLFRGHIAKIRDCVLPSAIVDGWGDVAPIVGR
jgi:HTH-type transcriptional regulator / antitoxin HigA